LITNTGEVSLTDIEIYDEIETPGGDIVEIAPDGDFSPFFVGGDDNNNGLLDPGETWVFEYSILADAPGLFENWAEVFAAPFSAGADVNAVDVAYWTVLGDPADDPADDEPADDSTDDPTGTQGLTPGFWRQSHHFPYWPAGYSPSDSYSAMFGVDDLGDVTLLQALTASGGGLNALLRQSAAALLNAAHPDVDYAFTADQVIRMVQAAIASGNFEATKDVFDHENNRGNVDLKSGSNGNDSGSGDTQSGGSAGHDEFFADLDTGDEDDDLDLLAQDVAGNGKGNENGRGRGRGRS
jgi:hypothetical protein